MTTADSPTDSEELLISVDMVVHDVMIQTNCFYLGFYLLLLLLFEIKLFKFFISFECFHNKL